ncbi:hypothetical protein C5D07_08510 [Rathayibacter tritici]|uniref:hypothetical protein n=1 Tax=Rathayibacter tritici TaxID=33888 RepID=UPI000CE90A06|nr:hypothetical protein [Rathayibacter tritici]PPF30367.1 hypothetical protein C5C06_05315 [Rathayibacter tritici]PPI14691.1 hypothetical protein C5D07_08510 [Rathayibacter tritici]
MRAVFVDESARNDRLYFFGALVVHEQAASAIEVGLNGIGELLAENVPGFSRDTEFHGNEMFHGEKGWDRVPVDFKIRRVPGYTDRQLSSLIDTMYFGPSHASRLLQATDVATYFSNRKLTIVEKDSRARAAVHRISSRIQAATTSFYVWYP